MYSINLLRTGALMSVLFCLLPPLNAFSQIHVGLVGGVTVGTLTMEDPDVVDVSSRTRFSLGGVVDVAVGQRFSLRAEPTYLRKGAVTTENDDGVPGENEFQFSYLEVPLLLSYTLDANPVRPYLTAGPSIGVFLDADDVVLRRPDGTFKADMDAVIERFDIGLALGSGVSYPVGRATLFVQGRYTLGLANINQGGLITVRDDVNDLSLDFELDPIDTKTRSLQLMVGLTVRLGN